jgi:hypothetical protein
VQDAILQILGIVFGNQRFCLIRLRRAGIHRRNPDFLTLIKAGSGFDAATFDPDLTGAQELLQAAMA